MNQPLAVSSEETRPLGAAASRWVGPVLLIAVALQIFGAFLRYQTVRPSGLGALPRGLPASFSFSYFDILDGGRPVFFLTLALIAALGYAATLRPSRVCGALVGGFCASQVGATAYSALYSTDAPKFVQFGPGYFLIFAALAIEACVATWMLIAVVLARRELAPDRRSVVGLAVVTAFVIGASTAIRDLKLFPGEPFAVFTPLSLKSGAAAVVGFVGVAAVPLLAARARGRVGSMLVVGLAAYETTRVLDVVNRRFLWPGLWPLRQVAIGWWVEILAVALLAAMAMRLAAQEQAPLLPVPPGEAG